MGWHDGDQSDLDVSGQARRVYNYVWDTSTLAWVVASGGATPGTNVNITNSSLPVTGTFWQATQPVSGPVTDAQLRASAVSVNVEGTVPVTGTFWQATQPVSGTVGVSGTVPVSGTFWQATQPVSAASLPLPTGASTEATLSTLNGKVTVCDTGAVVISGTVPVSGTFWQATQPTSLASLPALAAGTNRIGGAYTVCGQVIDENGTVRTVNRAFVNASGIGNTELVAAQGGSTRIRILSYTVVAAAATSVKFQSATTDIAPTMAFAANGGIAVPYNPHGLFQTAANEALNVNLSLGVAVGVNATWIQAT